MSETKLTAEPEDDAPDSAGPYTCIRCLAGTWNDDDICDECRAEALSSEGK